MTITYIEDIHKMSFGLLSLSLLSIAEGERWAFPEKTPEKSNLKVLKSKTDLSLTA